MMDFSALTCPKAVEVTANLEPVRCDRPLEIIEKTVGWAAAGHRYIVTVSCRRPKPDQPHFFHGEPRRYWLPREIAQAVAANLLPHDIAQLGSLIDQIGTPQYDRLVHKFASINNDAWPIEWDAYIRYLAAPGVPDDISGLISAH